MRTEYHSLYKDIEESIAFARIALKGNADAINMWIGNSRSTSCLHRDNYENIYCQIIGKKHFVLLPPVAMPCVNEQILQNATYAVDSGRDSTDQARSSSSCTQLGGKRDALPRTGEDFGSSKLRVVLDKNSPGIPFATWDPDTNEQTTPFSSLCSPLRVQLNPGDVLYLPAMW